MKYEIRAHAKSGAVARKSRTVMSRTKVQTHCELHARPTQQCVVPNTTNTYELEKNHEHRKSDRLAVHTYVARISSEKCKQDKRRTRVALSVLELLQAPIPFMGNARYDIARVLRAPVTTALVELPAPR